MDIYDAFIAYLQALEAAGRARAVPDGDYTEGHRILPGHAGGRYEPANIVRCSFENHRLAHYYRWLARSSEKDRYAWRLMCGWREVEARRAMASYAGKLGGRKASQVHQERGTNFYSSETQRAYSLRRSTEKKQRWMAELNQRLTREERSRAGRAGSQVTIQRQRADQTGFFDPRARLQRRANLVRWGIKINGIRIPFHRLSSDFVDYHVDRGTSREYFYSYNQQPSHPSADERFRD